MKHFITSIDFQLGTRFQGYLHALQHHESQLRPGLRFSVLLQEGHSLHRALHSFTNYGRELQSLFSPRREVHRQLACRRISEAGGGYQSLITDHWLTDYRQTDHWFTGHRSTGLPTTDTLVTDHQSTDHCHPSTVDYGLTNRSLTTLYKSLNTSYSVLTTKDWLYPRKPKNPV